jgi:hypothetical protein
MKLNLQSFLPKFAVVDSANHSDSAKAYEVCADIKAGEIVVFEKKILPGEKICKNRLI